MSDIVAYMVAGLATIVAALFGGAWMTARKQRDTVLTDHRDLARQASRQRIKIAELTIRQREQEAIQRETKNGLREIENAARSGTPADDFTARIRGGRRPPGDT